MIHAGACLCGRVAFEVDGDFDHFFLCHCERCRKDTGSAHAANLFSSTAALRWVKGQEHVRTFDFNATGHIKSFCVHCGSALPNLQQAGELVVVPAGSLDTDVPIRPDGHIFCAHRSNWDDGFSDVPSFDTLPQGGGE